MIITRTPLRVSFAGGGTDLPDFYERDYGAVLSTAINKYIYVTVKRHGELFNERFRLNYSETEQVEHLEEVKNAVARESLRLLGIEPPIYISTVADLPAFSGLGSSSSFAVGLLNGLHKLKNERIAAGKLAEEASHVEIHMLKQPIGKQDQYAAAYGGLNFISFLPGGRVSIEPLQLTEGDLAAMFAHTMMFWTGIKRSASTVLTEQRQNIPDKLAYLQKMRQHACDLRDTLRKGFQADEFARILDEGWNLKRQLASSISNSAIDAWYEAARSAGAMGGKLCGAGGGGFLLLVTPPDRQDNVRERLRDLREIRIGYEAHGTQVLLADNG